MIALLRGVKTPSGKGGLGAENPVQFARMPARFVDLQGKLGTAKYQCGVLARTDVRGQQRDRFVGYPFRITRKIRLADVLPAAGPLISGTSSGKTGFEFPCR